MATTIREEPIERLGEHGELPIAFVVESVFDVSPIDGGLGGLTLTERRIDVPWVKDYDADAEERPSRWPRHFDVTNWGLLTAYDGNDRLGGAVIAFRTDGVRMLLGRPDVAALWDIRVRQDSRSRGVGRQLFGAVETWCRERECRLVRVETQNVNVPACRFYRRMGCSLAAVDRHAYPGLPDEVQLIWSKDL